MPCFVDVIIPVPLQRVFTYHATESQSHDLEQGMRVIVPFGKKKHYTGIVYHIHNKAPLVYEAKQIEEILDETPLVTLKQLQLWQWIATYYMCTLGDVMRASLPSALILESETTLVKENTENLNIEILKDDEFLVYEALTQQPTIKIHDVVDIVNKKRVYPIINALIDKQVITVKEEANKKYKPKLERYIKLKDSWSSKDALQKLLDDLGRAEKQKQVVLSLFSISAKTKQPVKAKALIAQSQTSSTILKTLIKKNVLEEFYLRTDRIAYSRTEKAPKKILNKHQEQALSEIQKSFEKHDVTLLHGVTSSGKTEIYVKLIADAIAQNKQVLYLLPEIALTTQLVSRLQLYFGEYISVFHSKYSIHERVEVWYNILENKPKAQIIIGARSSVFLPFQGLGLIIVDEEHEQSFKQFDPAPRYHARDTAIVLAKLYDAKVLLGSATPSLESYFNASHGKYGLVALTKRYNDVLMPDIELVDMQDKYKKKLVKGHFTDRLITEMTETLQAGYQVILFQNRRGFSPVVLCRTCGHTPQCSQCDVSLTYHQYRNQLRCHYCGYSMPMQKTCAACGSPDIDTKGFGTEQIEKEAEALFPDYKVMRMDLDTTRGKYGYEKIIKALEHKEVDILVGTQMLTKGLDFRHIKLVGIMNADNMLNFPDFRAYERSFQLMAQVSGRAGRTQERGKVLIQTYNPHHNILQQVSTNDYKAMFKEQIEERYQYKYPPIYKQIKIILKHKDYNKVEAAALWYAEALRLPFKTHVLGPESPSVSRIRNQYHKHILIKIPKMQSLSKTKETILKINNSFLSIKTYRSVRVIFNVDNY